MFLLPSAILQIINFDLPYLLDRARALGVRDFPFLGRIRNSVTTIKNSKFESKAVGIRESKDIKIEGRIQFDCLDVIRREYKLRSYTLNAVCAEFLGSQKEDVHVSDFTHAASGAVMRRSFRTWFCTCLM
jgi:DNA polymerase delta subunit 1